MFDDFKALSCKACQWGGLGNSVSKAAPKPMDAIAAANGLSAFSCTRCKQHLPKTAESRFWDDNVGYECPCGATMSIYSLGYETALLPSSAPLLEKEAVKNVHWFHATAREDWMHAVTSGELIPYVHVGSRESALERAAQEYFTNTHSFTPSIYLWEVSIRPEAVIADDILNDEDNWCRTVTQCAREHIGGDVQRYLNKRESAGSISLMLDPRTLLAVQMVQINEEDCFTVLEKMLEAA